MAVNFPPLVLQRFVLIRMRPMNLDHASVPPQITNLRALSPIAEVVFRGSLSPLDRNTKGDICSRCNNQQMDRMLHVFH